MTKYNCEYNQEKWDQMYNREEVWQGAEPITDVFLFMTDAKSVLDVGAGRGEFMYYLEQHAPTIGIDISKWMIENKFCNSEIVHGNCTSLPFENNQFDLVLGLDILEHLSPSDLNLTLLEMMRVANKSIILLPAALSISEHEAISDDPTKDLANHLIFWKEDKWLKTISDILAPKFNFDADAVMRFTTILTRLGQYPQQWRHIEFYTKK